MKILLKLILFVFTITISNFVIGQDYLKIMTYNIQGMKPGTMPGFRIAYIIEKIKDIDPDIIGLQEINESIDGNGEDNQCNEIANSLSEHFNVQYTCYQQFTHLSWDNQFGVEVAILSDSFHQAGKYVAKLDASKLSGCVYFYSLKSDSFVQTKMMSVVR